MLSFRALQPTEDALWDDLVRASPQGNAFLQIATLRLLAAHEHPVARVWRVAAYQEDGTLAGGWAVLVRRRAGIRYCSSFPLCRLYAAAPESTPDEPCALVTVLLFPDQHCAWLWRVAYQTDDSGLIPALYLHAGEAVKREFGAEWTVNFGGSPNLSLARFKDYLGAVPTPHWRIRWQRRGAKALLWNGLQTLKETSRRRLTVWHVLRPPRNDARPVSIPAQKGGA
jgi:hypothetical protein